MIKHIQKITKQQSGQSMPYFFIMMIILVMCWAMMLNIAKLTKDRMMMQNAADNAAISVAVYEARILNLLGYLNYLSSSLYSLSSFPCGVDVPVYNLDYVGGSSISGPLCDYNCNKGMVEYHESSRGVENIKKYSDAIRKIQKSILYAFFTHVYLSQGTGSSIADKIGKRQEMNANGEFCGADKVTIIPAKYFDTNIKIEQVQEFLKSFSEPEKILGLEKNNVRVRYYKTLNIGANIPDHIHAVIPIHWKTTNESWYVGNESFKNQKLVAIAYKSANSPSNEGYPIFKKSFEIVWPSITTIAAASVYNTAGSMFPTKKSSITGMPKILIGINEIIVEQQLMNMVNLAYHVSIIPGIGPYLAVITGAAAATIKGWAVYALIEALNDKSSPIAKYENANYKEDDTNRRKGGWLAHLVPINKAGFQH